MSVLNILNSIRSSSNPDKEFSQSIRNILGFYPGNRHLYKLAFRHRSVAETINGVKVNNERLEYLGDAILGAVVAEFLFKRFPLKDEGFLTEMRSKIVCRNRLNKLAIKLGFDKLIKSTPETKVMSKSIRGDAFEALMGALYLDKGYEFTRKVIIHRIINMHIDIDELENEETNYKSRLIEWTQKEKKTIDFKLIEEVGEGIHKQYLIEILIDDSPVCRGQDFSIKNAEKHAAEKAWNILFPPEENQ